MINLNGLTFGYDGRTLLKDISLHIRPGDRLGLVGPNGTGKTTLLRILTGEVKGYDGSMSARKECTIGVLPQDGIYDSGRTVMESAMEAFAEVLEIEKEIEEIDNRLSHPSGCEDTDDLVERAGMLRLRFEMMDGFNCESKAASTLTGLGFSEEDLSAEVSTFSGGWQMRVALAKLLLRCPSVLLLDEPTNHLDLPAIIWFENFLHTFPGAVVVISHDRTFLDKVCKRTADLTGGKLEMYDGGYSNYEKERAMRLEILRNRMENQAREIKHTEQFIERFRYKATKARQVQSRIKALDKIERIEMPDEARSISFKFKASVQSGKSVLQLIDIQKAYDEKVVLKNVNLSINRGDRVAIIGANGLGKSTLVRVVADKTEYTGTRRAGHNVLVSYFSQDQYEILSPNKTVLEEASDGTTGGFSGNIRSLLGVFLFSGDDVNKKVSMLSGGEKSRLLLARMMASASNFLVLDEPTNHLDPASQEMLQRVFSTYDGTICLVSHNRSFIDAVATRIVEITREGISEYIGNFSDYMYQKKALADSAAGVAGPKETLPSQNKKADKKERAKQVTERSKVLKPIKTEIANAESEISRLELKITDIENELSNPETYNIPERMKNLPLELKAAKKKLEETLENWESLSLELAEKEQEFAE